MESKGHERPVAMDRDEARQKFRGGSFLNRLFKKHRVLQLGLAAVMVFGAFMAFGSRASGEYENEVIHEMDKKVFVDLVRDRIPASQVIGRMKGFSGKKPNIIIILTDDLGYGDVGCYGGTVIKTPNLDRLARQGVRFTDFYAGNSVCSPSRAGLLTGRYPHRTGITAALEIDKGGFLYGLMRKTGLLMAKFGGVDIQGDKSYVKGLPPSEITIAEALKTTGYTTACIGKWHLGDFTKLPEYHPHNHGFDHFAGFNASNDGWPTAFWRNQTEIEKDIGLDQEEYTGIFHKEAIDFIERSKDQPFFLYLAHKDPHQPCIPSKKFSGTSNGGPHGDTVEEVDWGVGEIMKCLERNGLEKDTLIFFTSDNGPWYDGSPGRLRGRKGQSYEGGYRVPMIAWWPDHILPGRSCSQPAMNIDFFPTILTLAGLDVPTDRIVDGRNIWGLLSEEAAKSPHDALFFFHDYEIEGIRAGKWKYFRYIHHYTYPIPLDKPNNFIGKVTDNGARFTFVSKDTGKKVTIRELGQWPLLYNLALDPGENYNVALHYPEIAKRHHDMLVAWEKAFYRNPRGWTEK
ncbi:MAG: sulfatase [Deltaproteobacteria bacterium]|nr:sulfatase [Deltaproteobacteria bacterium]